MGKLDGKVAIVTGAARGHSEAVARLFAAEGAAVSICDVVPVEVMENGVASKIREAGGRVICSQTDVSDEDQVNALRLSPALQVYQVQQHQYQLLDGTHKLQHLGYEQVKNGSFLFLKLVFYHQI